MNPNAVCRNRPVLRYQAHFSQNKRIIICVRNRSNLLQRIGLQLVDRVLEILKILKILVYTGESHIRDLGHEDPLRPAGQEPSNRLP